MGKSKIRRSDVLAIRASDEPVAVLAERYGVSTSTVRDIRHGRTWKGVVMRPPRESGRRRRKIFPPL